MRYRKIVPTIKAFQMTKKHGLDNTTWPNWLQESETVTVDPEDSTKLVFGGSQVIWGNWIIKDGNELSILDKDIFENTYEPAEPDPESFINTNKPT